MSLAKDLLTAVVLLALPASLASCGPPRAPGMNVVASSATTSGPGAVLVAFPANACTGSDSAVFIDEKGKFIGAVAPGTVAYLAFPEEGRLFVVSSNDVNAKPGVWFRRHEIAAPGNRVDKGILVDVARRDAKNCYPLAQLYPQVVSYETATRAALPLSWLDVRPDAGDQWLAEHRARVTELLDDRSAPTPAATTITRIP